MYYLLDKLNDNSFLEFGLKCFGFAIPGIILGTLVERVIERLKKEKNFSPVNLLFIQIFLSSVVLYIVQHFVSNRYAEEWQSTTPALLFVSLFFGVQSSLAKNSLEAANYYDI